MGGQGASDDFRAFSSLEERRGLALTLGGGQGASDDFRAFSSVEERSRLALTLGGAGSFRRFQSCFIGGGEEGAGTHTLGGGGGGRGLPTISELFHWRGRGGGWHSHLGGGGGQEASDDFRAFSLAGERRGLALTLGGAGGFERFQSCFIGGGEEGAGTHTWGGGGGRGLPTISELFHWWGRWHSHLGEQGALNDFRAVSLVGERRGLALTLGGAGGFERFQSFFIGGGEEGAGTSSTIDPREERGGGCASAWGEVSVSLCLVSSPNSLPQQDIGVMELCTGCTLCEQHPPKQKSRLTRPWSVRKVGLALGCRYTTRQFRQGYCARTATNRVLCPFVQPPTYQAP